MAKKHVSVSLRKPSPADPITSAADVEAFVRGQEDTNAVESVAFNPTSPRKLRSVKVAPRTSGDAIEARVEIGAAADAPAQPSIPIYTPIAEPIADQVAANVAAHVEATKVNDTFRTMTIRIPEQLAARLDAYCERNRREVGELIADLVGALLDGTHDPSINGPMAALRIVTRWVRYQLARWMRSAYVPAATT